MNWGKQGRRVSRWGPRCLLVILAGFWLNGTALATNVCLRAQRDPFPTIDDRYGDVWGEGNYAYVGSFNGTGVMIFDISTASAPVLLTNYNPAVGGQFKDVKVQNGIGYFPSDNGGGLHIVDLADPAAPVLITRITSAMGGYDSIHNISVNGSFVYEADAHTPTVKVFNVSNPSSPSFVTNIVTTDPSLIHDCTAIGNRLYTSGFGGKTDIYDVSNIATGEHTLLGSINSGSNSHSNWTTEDGNILVSAREINNGDVRIYDISDPASPVLRSTLTAAGLGISANSPHNPLITNNLLFVSWYQAGVQILDITDPADPVHVGLYDTFAGPVVGLDGNWGVFPFLGLNRVLASDLDGGLFVLDASGIGGPDTDGDGMPDAWERFYGLNPSSAGDAGSDADGDGLVNADEYYAGTNPRDPSSFLRITSVQTLTNGNVSVGFPSACGRQYQLQRNSSVTSVTWTNLPGSVIGNGDEKQFTDVGGAAQTSQVYRIRLAVPEALSAGSQILNPHRLDRLGERKPKNF